ncbi:hypothetical protein CYY_008166 [Polysphondylium violaceum]|uniref:JmjC domain-containing protein n=1 Tax=Polysphondylium violaceum TaxID=133409 RepID=A0A8J4PNB9_9MYCE|nr:hypothetical protein CYY_008166 [Polysphondylium violaceum]
MTKTLPTVTKSKALEPGVEFRNQSLGSLSVLSDAILLTNVFYDFSIEDLLKYQALSPAFYVLLNDDLLWKDLFLKQIKGNKKQLVFDTNWKITAMHYLYPSKLELSRFPFKQLSFQNFYSLEIYTRWLRRHTIVKDYGFDNGQVDHVDSNTLSVEEFIEKYEKPSIPVIFKGIQKDWSATEKWTSDKLAEKYGDVLFKISHQGHKRIPMKFKDYVDYMKAQNDEEPLYVFDEAFGEKAEEMLTDYSVPKYFPEDLFEVSGKERPHFRWIVIGPPRSGAPWHIDPAGTSAWNSLLTGRKRWLMYPPSFTPIGVGIDDVEEKFYGSPPSLLWLLEVYPYLPPDQRPIECIQEPGETIFVPGGWWHMVLNMEESIAVTQNFCNSQNFMDVCEELSGNRKEYENFKKALLDDKPEFKARFDDFELMESQMKHSFDNMDVWGPMVRKVYNKHIAPISDQENIDIESPNSGQSPVFIVNKQYVVKFYSTEYGGESSFKNESFLYQEISKNSEYLKSIFPQVLGKGFYKDLNDINSNCNGNGNGNHNGNDDTTTTSSAATDVDKEKQEKPLPDIKWKWPYIISSFVDGINLQEVQIVPEALPYPYPPQPIAEGEDDQDDEEKPSIDDNTLVDFMVKALSNLHNIKPSKSNDNPMIPDSNDQWSMWKKELTRLYSEYRHNHWNWNGLPSHLRSSMQDYLPKDINQLIDNTFSPCYLHTDLTDENVLGQIKKAPVVVEKPKKKSLSSRLKKMIIHPQKRKSPHKDGGVWEPKNLIDLGDSKLGDRWYELISLHLSVFAGDKTRFKQFLSKYIIHSDDNKQLDGKTWLDYYNLDPKAFVKRAMSYTLIHHCDAITTITRHFPSYRNASTIDHLACLIWDLDFAETSPYSP